MVKQSVVILICTVLLLSGCNWPRTYEAEEKRVIKVLHDSESRFMELYGNIFMAKYPQYDLQVVTYEQVMPDQMKRVIENKMNDEKPDLIILPTNELYWAFEEEGKLHPLDAFVRGDSFDTADLAPIVVDLLNNSRGQLFGLAPSFASSAVYYNKALFDQYNVPYPQDQMSWEQLFELAKRFPNDGNVTGFQFAGSDPFYLAMTMSRTHQLEIYDPVSNKVIMNSDRWKNLLQLAADAYLSDAVMNTEFRQEGDPFLHNKTAMFYTGNYFLEKLYGSEGANVDWDIVTPPVDPQNPGWTDDYHVRNIFAISSQASDPRSAWEFIQFIHSVEYANIMFRAVPDFLMTNINYLSNKDPERNLAAFFELKPLRPQPTVTELSPPNNFYYLFSLKMKEEFGAVFQGEKTAVDALETLQHTGEELLSVGAKGGS